MQRNNLHSSAKNTLPVLIQPGQFIDVSHFGQLGVPSAALATVAPSASAASSSNAPRPAVTAVVTAAASTTSAAAAAGAGGGDKNVTMLECHEGSSNKFYEIKRVPGENKVVMRYGELCVDDWWLNASAK